jgi:hypothetical protein
MVACGAGSEVGPTPLPLISVVLPLHAACGVGFSLGAGSASGAGVASPGWGAGSTSPALRGPRGSWSRRACFQTVRATLSSCHHNVLRTAMRVFSPLQLVRAETHLFRRRYEPCGARRKIFDATTSCASPPRVVRARHESCEPAMSRARPRSMVSSGYGSSATPVAGARRRNASRRRRGGRP